MVVIFPHHRLRAIFSACSGHAPLLLHTSTDASVHKHFRFEDIWPHLPGYLDAVAEGWRLTLQNVDACRILDFKLRNTAKALRRWSQKYVLVA
jgi:hypothetical protein